MITHEQKLAMYEAGLYRFKAPSVCTARWDTDAWINFIDSYDGWDFPNLRKIDYLTQRLIDTRAYIRKCVAERELWKQNPAQYGHEYYVRLAGDKELRDRVSVNLEAIKLGLKGELFAYVENIDLDDSADLSVLLGLPTDQPFRPFIDHYMAAMGYE